MEQLDWSDSVEILFTVVAAVVCGVFAFFTLSPVRINGSKWSTAPYKRAHMLKIAGAFFIQSIFAAYLFVDMESFGQIIFRNSSLNFRNGVMMRNLRMVQIQLVWGVFQTYAMASYQGFPGLETVGITFTGFLWGLNLVMLNLVWNGWQYWILFGIGTGIFLAMMAAFWGESQLKWAFMTLDSIMYILYAGGAATIWVVELMVRGRAVYNDEPIFTTNWVPQVIYWVVLAASSIALAIIGYLNYDHRVPRFNDYHTLIPYYDAVHALIQKLIGNKVIGYSKARHQWEIVNTGLLTSASPATGGSSGITRSVAHASGVDSSKIGYDNALANSDLHTGNGVHRRGGTQYYVGEH